MTLYDLARRRDDLAAAIAAVMSAPEDPQSRQALCALLEQATSRRMVDDIDPVLAANRRGESLSRRDIEVLVAAGDELLAFYEKALGPGAVTERDIWATANLVIQQHGEHAWLHAAQRSDALLERGDVDGARVWRRIKRAIDALGSREAGVAAH